METNNSKNLLKKVPWGSLIAIFAFLAIILLAAVVGIWFVLDSIAQQTHNNATLFDNWWQVLMFIVDILSFVGLGISIFYFVVFKEEKRIEKENNPIKVPVFLNKTCFGLMTTFFAVVSAGFAIGGPIANSSENFINDFLGIKPYEVVQTDGEEIIFNEYLSDYIERDELGNPIYKKNEDGRYVPVFNDKKMRDNSLRVATQVSTEGSVLLFNKNNSLPLQKDNKISFFGISSAEYIFSAAGSGHLGVSVTTSLQSSC